MHFIDIPQECILRLLFYLDLPDQHSLLLTSRSLFQKVVPGLYRSPFRAIVAYDGWRLFHTPTSQPLSSSIPPPPAGPPPPPPPPPPTTSTPVFVHHPAPHSNNHSIKSTQHSNNVANVRPASNHQQRFNNISTSSISSISTTSTSTSSYSLSHRASAAHLTPVLHNGISNGISNASASTITTITTKKSSAVTNAAHHPRTAGPEARHAIGAQTLVQVQNQHRRSASLQQRSYSDQRGYSSTTGSNSNSNSNSNSSSSSNGNANANGKPTSFSQVNLRLKGSDIISNNAPPVVVNVNNPYHSRHVKSITATVTTAPTRITALEQLKLNRITRLLQLLIACTPVQARLPALRYPGYGQQWIRAPCRIDYLQHYIDQQQGNEIMIQCFHLLFADLIHCRGENDILGGLVPMTPPDKEAYRVLYRIQREFMTHCAPRIRTLSVSVAHTIDHATSLVSQLATVTRLELTDLEELAENQNTTEAIEKVLDLIKSHRLLFGPVLKDLILAEKSDSSKLLATSAPTSPISLAPTGLTTPPTSVPSSPTTPFGPLSSSPFTDSYYTSRVPVIYNNKSPHNNILTILEAVKNPERIDAVGWANAILHLDRIPTTHLKCLWLSFAFPSSESTESKAARLGDYLEKCRQLEQLRIPIRRPDVFGWAAHEKKSSLICAPILASSRTKRLPKLCRIHLQGPSLELLDCVLDAAFAFQDTLQDLEAFSGTPVWQPITLEWDWYMPRLTKLRLEGPISMHFGLDSLQRCPVLEELTLSTIAVEDWKCQRGLQPVEQCPSQHHQPQISDPASYLWMYIRSREMHRIGSLRRLKTLRLEGPWHLPDTALRRIADRCTRLRELTLNRTLGSTPGGVLLAVENMRSLERLDLRMNVQDLHLVRVVTPKLPFLKHVRVTSLRQA